MADGEKNANSSNTNSNSPFIHPILDPNFFLPAMVTLLNNVAV